MNTILSAQSIKREVDTKSGLLTILDDVSLELRAGESVAIQGASGSGKSSLLGVLAGLDIPQQGKVVIEGREITDLDEDQRAVLRANNVGFVFQSFYLIDDLTALENVALPLELFGHADPIATATDWLERLGLGDRIGHLPRQLSGGEQQRVALCRAFAVQPKILFADEPTANLDTRSAAHLMDLFVTLNAERDITFVISTHDTRVMGYTRRLISMRDGKIVGDEQQEPRSMGD